MATKQKKSAKPPGKSAAANHGMGERARKTPAWMLRLYVAGNTPNSVAAFANLKELCEVHLGGKYQIEVIDLLRNPQLAQGDQIVAVPTLVRKLPHPVKRIIGDLSNRERVLVGLDLRPAMARAAARR